ncbi:MAG TPA: methyltransferase [Burkholderiales bacterium]
MIVPGHEATFRQWRLATQSGPDDAGWSITGWQLQPPFLGLELTRGIGAIMILAGVPGLVDAFARFALQGLGTPAPIAPTRNLVVTGLYRYVRNPIYVAVVAIILGQAALMGDWRLIVYGALLWLACHVFVVVYEEPTLERTFWGRVRGVPRRGPALDTADDPMAVGMINGTSAFGR